MSGTNERVSVSSTGARKGKKDEQFGLIPWESMRAVARVYAMGAKKYDDPYQWRAGYKWSLSFDALMRHATAFWQGEDVDSESNESHLAHVVFHALSLIYYSEYQRSFDDRPKPPSCP